MCEILYFYIFIPNFEMHAGTFLQIRFMLIFNHICKITLKIRKLFLVTFLLNVVHLIYVQFLYLSDNL